jgi:hypothetical protein
MQLNLPSSSNALLFTGSAGAMLLGAAFAGDRPSIFESSNDGAVVIIISRIRVDSDERNKFIA